MKTLCILFLTIINLTAIDYASAQEWESVETIGEPLARHEAAFIEFEGKFYLLGGRRIQAVSIYSPSTNTWSQGSPPPIEVHHFQPVVYKDRILIICAFTGQYPHEKPIAKTLAYIPQTDTWEWGDEIPEARRRGAAGVVNIDDTIYIVSGITNGHMNGYINWFDQYCPKTNDWKVLENAPHKRDHFQAAYLDGKLYAAGGRHSSKETEQTFELVVPLVDVYDFHLSKWSSIEKPLPTPRAGSMTMALDKQVIVIGGESATQVPAHSEVEAYDTLQDKWTSLPDLKQGRHGTGIFLFKNHIYTCSGCGNRGGDPELTTMERLELEN